MSEFMADQDKADEIEEYKAKVEPKMRERFATLANADGKIDSAALLRLTELFAGDED